MRVSYHTMLHHISFPGYHSRDTDAAAMLLLISCGRYPFNVPLFTQRNHHILMGNEVFILKFFSLFPFNSSTALVAVSRFEFSDILFNQEKYLLRVRQQT